MSTITAVGAEEIDLSDVNAVSDYIYNGLIPMLELRGILLSAYGNHAGRGSICSVAEYNSSKQIGEQHRFDVARIVQVIPMLPAGLINRESQSSTSYGLKASVVERGIGGYISNGDFIVAMLLRGYSARFGTASPNTVNCTFMNP